MVDAQLIPRGIKSAPVLEAMLNTPRHLFVPADLRHCAYDDSPIPIGYGQTISQPYIVAFMTEQLYARDGMKILEIGTGSGYQAAILANLGCEVYTIELIDKLVSDADKTFISLGISGIRARRGDGYIGWPEAAPFDAIIVTAAPACIPKKLIGQLGEGGKMVVPVGAAHSVQSLKLIEKKCGEIIKRDLLPVRFVPMVVI